ncbi:putative DNA primase/helicase [Hephaestia caeni]|uniref:Putative DNA primase/helicase n=1 Tax=Hephaestia caeni TaxID=645617 RepID=A0A397NP93_9SPHN|nr:phage/plasmid primase, P4 family [Hephaestia caeni]RIA37489.1 putative DNA primase/helicase [Hephaestia caeni]
MTDQPAALLDAALAYARRGWPVFPCSPKNKRPLLPRDKDAAGKPIPNSGGVTKATIDEDLIAAWWRRWPRAMIGVSVGRAGMLVVDFDPRVDEIVDPETGEVTTETYTLDRLKVDVEAQIGCALPTSLAVRTPSGGVHCYFQQPEGAPIGNKGTLPEHVDVRGLGGYVIVPPSVCDGDARNAAGPYRWLRGDAEAGISAMPAPLIEALRAPPPRKGSADAARAAAPPPRPAGVTVDLDEAHRKYALNALDAEVRELAGTPRGGGRHGGRNQGAYWAAFNLGQLVGAGALSESIVRAALLDVVRGFDPAAFETHKGAIENGLNNGIAKPRDLTAVGGPMARGRDSVRSAGPSAIAPPTEAYADDLAAQAGPAPAPDRVDDASFQNGMESGAFVVGARGGRIVAEPDAEMDRRCALFPLTDLGNAERFRARHGWRFRFCNELGWFVWDRRRWALLSEEKDKVPGQVSLAVFETVRAIRNEAKLVATSGLREDDKDDPARMDFVTRWKGAGDNKVPVYYSEELAAHAKSSEGASRIGCIANLAKAFTDIAIAADAMDRDRMAINVLNGTIRIGLDGNKPVIRLDAHRPDDLISKIAAVAYDPDAAAPAYDDFLATVQPAETMRRFLHQWGGLSLTGDIGEQKLVFHHGGGRNGKSTLNDLWATIAGDYGASVAIETFLDQGRGRKGGEATPDLARLPGVRFLRTSEPEKGAKLAEALIKLVTGGEPIDARHLNKSFFTFLPSFKLSVQGNHKPKITGHDDGIWRRMMLVPWAVQIEESAVDAKLPEKLRKEASGVLNRLLAGLLDWKMNGLIAPDEVIAATAKYREQSDQLGRFLAACTRPEAGARSKSSLLFALFTAWCKATGAAEWQPQGFSKAMEDRGFEKKASNGMQWLDIAMTRAASDFDEEGDGRSRSGPRDDPGPDYDDLPP